MLGDYYRLTKPGIVYGNALTTLAAFLFASRWSIALPAFCSTLIGISLVIASACVCNNYLDRDIDRKMARTKDRALAAGRISGSAALTYGAALGIAGLALLYLGANPLSAGLGLFGFAVYVIVYGWAKRASPWGTVVGSISGSVPIVVGYAGAAGHLDTAAAILFLILALWQMPHFYAIALYRRDDYEAAGIPAMPLVRGVTRANYSIIAYIAGFAAAAVSLTLLGYAGWSYFAVVLIAGATWLVESVRGLSARDEGAWARRLFLYSLIVLLVFCAALAFSPLVP